MMKKLFEKKNLQGLRIVFLNIGEIILEQFDDIFDFFNYVYENNFQKKKFMIHCFDPKKAHLLIHLLDE